MSVADAISNIYYENLLAINTKNMLNEKVIDELGLTKEDLQEIISVLPAKVEEANKQLNFKF